MTVDGLIRAYRANRAAARRRTGETQMNYANAGIAAMVANRVASANRASGDELWRLRREIAALPHGEDLLAVLDREDGVRREMRDARAFGGERWERVAPTYRAACAEIAREVKAVAAKIRGAQA